MGLLRPLALLLIVAGIPAHAQVFEGLDLTPKKKPKTRIAVTLTAPVPGAQLFIDGEAAGELPLAEKVVKPGDHALKVERPGYRTIEETVTAAAGKKTDLSYTLEPIGAVLTVEASAEGATCAIDGAAPQPLPLTQVVAEGTHTLVIAADGFKSEKRTIEATLGADLKESFTLTVGEDRPTQVNLEPPETDNDLELELTPGKKRAEGTPFFSRWYVWAGIAAVVAGGVATAVAVTQAPKPTPDPTVICGGPCDATIGWPAR